MSKTYTLTQSNVTCVTGAQRYNYVTLESTLGQSGDNIVGSFWFRWHEPMGFNCFGVSYMWYIRFVDANGNRIKDVNITPTNVGGYAARLFYFPTSTSQPIPVNSSNCRTEPVLDRFANDSTSTRTNLYSSPYWSKATKCKNGELIQRINGTYTDETRISFSIPLSEVPPNAKAYCNYVTFSQYIDSATGRVQDPTDPANQFSQYQFPSGSVAINSDPLIIDFASKIYYKNGTWSNRARVYHKASNNWSKKFLYRKINGTWIKVP